jgi:tetratricopeptide (TPR) repeat protein
MAGDTLRAPDGADPDRLDALRQSLSGLLARFTADRDALITTVQECEQRLEEVAARVEANHTEGRHMADGAGAVPQLDDLKQAVERLRLETRNAEARTQATAEQAMARADEALQSIEALAAAHGGSPDGVRASFTEEGAATRIAVQEFARRLEQLESNRHASEAEACTAAKRAMSRADETADKIEALVAAVQTHEDHTTTLFADLAKERERLGGAVRDCEQRLSTIATRQADTRAPAAFEELKHALERLKSSHREAETRTQMIVERVNDTVAKIDALTATQPARDTDLRNELAGFEKGHAALTSVVQDCERRLTLISAHLETSPTMAHIDEMKGLIERLQSERQQADMQGRAVSADAMARADAAMRRGEELAGTSSQTTREIETLGATVRKLSANLVRLTQDSEHAVPALTATVSALTQRVDALRAEMQENRQAIEQTHKERQPAPAMLQPAVHVPRTNAQVQRDAKPARMPWRQASLVAAGLCLTALGAVVAARWMTPVVQSAVPAQTAATQPESQVVQAPARPVGDSASAQPAAAGPGAVAPERPGAEEIFATGLEAIGRGDISAAEVAFNELIKLQPDSAEARNNLAVVLVEQGRIPEATALLRRALELRPDYDRARANLQRLQAPSAARAPAPEQARPILDIAARIQEPKSAETAPPAHVPPVQPEPASAPVPSAIVALEPLGATACVVEPANSRVCLYRRTADGIAADGCYGIAAAQIRAWPQWLVTGDVTPRRMRLVDETGQNRLTVLSEGASAGGDVVRLQQSDFDAVSSKVVSWHTSWVVLDGKGVAAGDSDIAAMRAALERWRQTWEGKQLGEYVGTYSASFIPQSEADSAHWRAHKRSVFERSGSIAVQIAAPSVFFLNQGNTVFTSFEQSYRSAVTTSRDFKVLRWQREHGTWTIGAETVLEEHAGADAG